MDASVDITVKRNNRLVSITLGNNKYNKIVKKDGIIQTTKKNDSYHGYGLLNIECLAKKHNGSLEVEYTDSMFTVSLLLTIPQGNCISDMNTYTSAEIDQFITALEALKTAYRQDDTFCTRTNFLKYTLLYFYFSCASIQLERRFLICV